MCEERFAGEMISTVGGLLPGGMARVEVVVVGRVVVVEGFVVDGVEVVVVVGTVVVVTVVLDVVPSSGAVVDVDESDPAAMVPVGSLVVEFVSSVDGEHAAISSSVARASAETRASFCRVRDTPTESRTGFHLPDRRRLRSFVVRVPMRSVVSSIP